MKNNQAVFYFSLRSPYSWLAWHDLYRGNPARLAEIELAPFWEPDPEHSAQLDVTGDAFLYAPMSRDKHMYILADVRALAQERGLSITWPVDRVPRWEIAHHAYFVARKHRKEFEYIDAIYKARWLLGKDISDEITVAAIAQELGLPVPETVNAYRDPGLRVVGLEALRRCVKDGVFGVPFFISRREKFWGLDRLPRFLKAQEALVEAGPTVDSKLAEQLPAHRTIYDHAGGCG